MNMYKLSEVLGIESVEIPDELFEFEKTDIIPPTRTSFKKGHLPHYKGKKAPIISQRRKEYWERWRTTNVSQKEIYVGSWSPPHGTDNTTKLNKTIIKCPHCEKQGNVGNMKRWHFDNCGKQRNIVKDVQGRFVSNKDK